MIQSSSRELLNPARSYPYNVAGSHQKLVAAATGSASNDTLYNGYNAFIDQAIEEQPIYPQARSTSAFPRKVTAPSDPYMDQPQPKKKRQ